MELWALTFHVHSQDKTREICMASCLMVVKGDSLKDHTNTELMMRSLLWQLTRFLFTEHIQEKAIFWSVKFSKGAEILLFTRQKVTL